MKEYLEQTIEKWAEAIATRISDEWDGNKIKNEEDVILLKETLKTSFINVPDSCVKLIGTSIIEEDYFDNVT
jgi:hypothetical protein